MQDSAGAPLDRSHIAPITTREELIYLLSRASELEHGLSCIYLSAAYSLKGDVSEGGLTPAQAEMVRRWKRQLAAVAVEEMLHLGQVSNILTAIGGAPHFKRTNFPLPPSSFPFGIRLSLEPFCLDTIERFVCYEMPEPGILSTEQQAGFDAMRTRVGERNASPKRDAWMDVPTGFEPFEIDYSTQGEFYHKVVTAFDHMPEQELFIGPREAQANARFLDFEGKMIQVFDRKSAHAAIEMIIEQGEAPTKAHPDAHFVVFETIRAQYAAAMQQVKETGIPFDPVRPVISNPMTRFYDDATGGTLITDPLAHEVADLFNVAYDTMLLMLMRFFAHTDETEVELDHLGRATLRLMTTVLRPLGEALTKMPAGIEPHLSGKTAGPGFGYNRDVQLLPHKRSAWVFFGERLRQLATAATTLCITKTCPLPAEIEEAAAALQALSELFAPADRTWNAAAEIAEFRAIEAGVKSRIRPQPDGPYLVTNLEVLANSKGERLPARPEMALCRCGRSASKPFCDGTHARVGFVSAVRPDRTPDGVVDYPGAAIVVHFNRLQCSASERCAKGLPAVFREGEKPWIQPEQADAAAIVAVIDRCPSGALRYTRNGATGPRPPVGAGVRIMRDGPYEVQGIALDTAGWSEGAARDRYTLCRCGESKNKPFCDGSHWRVGFKDESN